MTIKKPSNEEDEYFAREEAQKKHALAVEHARNTASSERERLQKLHYMKCPKCGFDLEAVKFRELTIDKCYQCNGTWLDAGELQALAGKDLTETLAAVFKR